MLYFDHWIKVPADLWRWANFSPEEIACRGTGKVYLDPRAMDALQRLRDILGAPVMLNSAGRSPEHNRAVGGATGSWHLKGGAFDVSMANHDPEAFEVAARAAGFTGFGFYPRNNFIHVDIGPDREWGNRWKTDTPASARAAPRFSPPPPHRPETIAEDGGARGTAIGASGAVGVLTALGGAISDLSPVAQIIATLGALALIGGLAYLARAKIKEWL